MASIDFDPEDYIDEIDDKTLETELRRRTEKAKRERKPPDVHAWTPEGLAADLRMVFYSRNASRFEDLLRVLEQHEETV